jgi:hypothetical protein
VVADLGAVGAGAVVEYDVGGLVTGDGVYSMALVATSSDGFAAYAREGASAPRLVLATGTPTVTATLEADTYAAAAAPDTAFGGASILSSDASPLEESYLRFRVAGLTGRASRAILRLRCTDATSDGPALYAAAGSWSETSLTWNTRPARSGGVVADLGAASVGQTVDYDVTPLVTGDATFTFALVATSTSGFAASSREGGTPPQLIVTP